MCLNKEKLFTVSQRFHQFTYDLLKESLPSERKKIASAYAEAKSERGEYG